MSKYYSQNDEEPAILSLLENAGIKQGRFLDIGAYDGKTFSNTLRLAELGWSGVCIEPSPSVFPALLKLHGDNHNIELVQAAVAPHPSAPGLLEFWDSGGDAISTTSIEHVQKWQKGYSAVYKKFMVYPVPLSEIFLFYGYQFEFINIDVESTNFELFKALPLNLLVKTRGICVEHDGHTDDMLAFARHFGYDSVYTSGENLILAR